MSVTITLLPLALAAAGLLGGGGLVTAATVAGGSREGSGGGPARTERAVQVQTRMKDLTLLDGALGDIGADAVDVGGNEVRATIDGMEVTMTRDADGVWQSRFVAPGLTDAQLRDAGTSVIERLDAAYAVRVQRAVAARIRERADGAGFELTGESQDEDTLTMVLTVRDGA